MAPILSRVGGAIASGAGAIERAFTPQRSSAGLPPMTNLDASRPSITQYLTENAKAFDPRTPSGLFNLATILVPGKGAGLPTDAQEALLSAIHFSSRSTTPGINAAFNFADPSVRALVRAGGPGHSIGRPDVQYSSLPGISEAKNPLDRISGSDAPTLTSGINRMSRAGLYPERGFPAAYLTRLIAARAARGRGLVPANPADRMAMITRILQSSAIARRN
jgi:hypothetical protein